MRMTTSLGTVFAIGLALSFAHVVSAQNEISGTMMVVKGDVKVTSAKSGKTDPAKVGTKVYSGDTIASAADSRAKIVMSDKNVINISPDSKITIEKYENSEKGRNVELKVDYGKVRASVEQKYDGEKNKFNIRTPTAVAGVRGTDFVTGFNRATGQTRIVTFTGVVAAGQAGPGGQILNAVFVRPGMATNIEQGKPPEPPRPMPASDLKNIEAEMGGASGALPDSAGPVDGPADKQNPTDQAENKPDQSQNADQAAGDKPAERAPAAIPGQMLDAKDLDTVNIVKDIGRADGSAPIQVPVNFVPIQPQPVGPIISDFVKETSKTQRSNVRVIIVPQ